MASLCIIGLTLETYVSFSRKTGHFDSSLENGLNFFAFFTAQSAILVLLSSMMLIKQHKQTTLHHILHVSSLAAIGTTFIIHRLYLAAPYTNQPVHVIISDGLLHVVIPLLAWIVWLLFREPIPFNKRVAFYSFAFPTLWILFTLARGKIIGFYPYTHFDPTLSSLSNFVIKIAASYVVYAVFVGIIAWRRAQ